MKHLLWKLVFLSLAFHASASASSLADTDPSDKILKSGIYGCFGSFVSVMTGTSETRGISLFVSTYPPGGGGVRDLYECENNLCTSSEKGAGRIEITSSESYAHFSSDTPSKRCDFDFIKQ